MLSIRTCGGASAWLISAALAACGCTGGEPAGAAGDAGARDAGGGPGSDASSDGAAGDAGARDAGGAPGSDGAGSDQRSIYALAVGHTWHSAYTSSGFGTVPLSCDEVNTITGTIDVDGRHAFVDVLTYNNCPAPVSPITQYLALGADDRLEYGIPGDSEWRVWDPPSEGHTWATGQNGFLVYTWHATAQASAPAGTFSDCWIISTTSSGSDQHLTYCRGIGQVTTDERFGTGFQQAEQLTSKNF